MSFAPPSARGTLSRSGSSVIGSVKHTKSSYSVASHRSGMSTSSRLSTARMQKLRTLQRDAMQGTSGSDLLAKSGGVGTELDALLRSSRPASSASMSKSASMSSLPSKGDTAKRAALGDMLMEKLLAKYRLRLPEQDIRAAVLEVLGRDRIRRSDIKELDTVLSEMAATAAADLPLTPSTADDCIEPMPRMTAPVGSAEELAAVLPITEGSVWGAWSGKRPTSGLPPKPKLTPRSKAKEEWAILAKYDQVVDEEKAKVTKEETKKARAELRTYLDNQVAQRKAAAKAEVEDDHSWSHVFNAEKEAADAEEARKIQARKDRELRDKITREEQMKDRAKRRELEKKAQADYEAKLIQKVIDDTHAAELRAAKKREEEREKYRQIFEDNRKHQELKQQQAAKEAEEDLERMAQYAKVLEEQERKREEMFRSFTERQEKLGKQKVDYKPPDLSGRVLMSDEKFAEQEKQRAAEAEAARLAKIAKRKAEDEACREFVQQQLNSKQELVLEEKKREEEAARRAIEEAAKFEAEERERVARRRKAAAEYKKELEKQISSRVAATMQMSETEKALNAEYVRRAFETVGTSM